MMLLAELRAVRKAERALRKMNPFWKPGVGNRGLRRCKRGHRMTPQNTGVTRSTGRRHCLKCKRMTLLLWKAGVSVTGRRGRGLAKACRRGHPRNAANVYEHPSGAKNCRLCRAMSQRKYRDRKAARGVFPPLRRQRCRHGHPYTAETIGRYRTGGVYCKKCGWIRTRKWKERHQAQEGDRRARLLAQAGILLPGVRVSGTGKPPDG
jgi:hypothetical protein